ncbi:hypothetical protein ACNKHM_10375 [Shigella sonnei]
MREQDAPITADQLLAPCAGERTEEGMRANVAWLCSTSKRESWQWLCADLWPNGRCGDG